MEQEPVWVMGSWVVFRHLVIYLERKLLPGVERFAEELGQQSDDPVVSQKEVKLVAKLDLGLELFVLDLELPE